MENQSEELRAAAVYAEDIRNELNGLLNTLDANISEAMATKWSGLAAVAFQGLMVQYRDSSDKLHQSLTSISEQLRNNGVAYEAAESEAQSQIQSAASLTGI